MQFVEKIVLYADMSAAVLLKAQELGYSEFSKGFHPFDIYGWRIVVWFPNGYGASIIQTCFSYGNHEELWELAVMEKNHGITYETPLGPAVLGSLNEEEIMTKLEEIAALPSVVSPPDWQTSGF